MRLCPAPERHNHPFPGYLRMLHDDFAVRAQRIVEIEDDPALATERDHLAAEQELIWQHIETIAATSDPYSDLDNVADWELAEISATSLIPFDASPNRLDYKAIKSRVDLVAYVAQYTQLRKTGRAYKGKCPFPDHSDSTASFNVYADNQTFWCYGCRRGRDLFDFVAYMGLEVPQP